MKAKSPKNRLAAHFMKVYALSSKKLFCQHTTYDKRIGQLTARVRLVRPRNFIARVWKQDVPVKNAKVCSADAIKRTVGT